MERWNIVTVFCPVAIKYQFCDSIWIQYLTLVMKRRTLLGHLAGDQALLAGEIYQLYCYVIVQLGLPLFKSQMLRWGLQRVPKLAFDKRWPISIHCNCKLLSILRTCYRSTSSASLYFSFLPLLCLPIKAQSTKQRILWKIHSYLIISLPLTRTWYLQKAEQWLQPSTRPIVCSFN